MAKTHRHHKKQRGGGLAGNPPSAWGWGLGTMGSGWQQFMDTLTLQPGQSQVAAHSNNIVIKGGQRRRIRSRRGGNIGAVLNQAVAPLALLGMQQMYGKSKKRRRH